METTPCPVRRCPHCFAAWRRACDAGVHCCKAFVETKTFEDRWKCVLTQAKGDASKEAHILESTLYSAFMQ